MNPAPSPIGARSASKRRAPRFPCSRCGLRSMRQRELRPLCFAKLLANVVALGVLQCVLIPLFAVLADVPLAVHPWALILVAALGNLGIAAVGTLLSALSAGLRQKGSLLVLLVLPLAVPVLLAASEATRLAGEDGLGAAWWRWVQLLAAFALAFSVAGTLLIDVAVED